MKRSLDRDQPRAESPGRRRSGSPPRRRER
jgi:hypothetical protein